MPKGGTINRGMVDGATNENAVAQLGYLYSKQRLGSALQVSNSVEWEKRVDNPRSVDGSMTSEVATPSALAYTN